MMTKHTVWMGAIFSMGFVSCMVEDDALQRFEDIQTRDGPPPDCQSDILYIVDRNSLANLNDDAVARFDANTGDLLGNLIPPPDGVLNAPSGILADKNNHVLLANQNTHMPEIHGPEPVSGSLFRLTLNGNAPPKVLFPYTHEHGGDNPPWIPRGMIIGEHNVLYMADIGDVNNPTPPNDGRVTLRHSKSGAYVGDLDFGDFDSWRAPRGIVMGPDGTIYVSNSNLSHPDPVERLLGGSILRFDPETREFVNVVYECDREEEPECDFHRPEGIVFDPHGRLLVAAYRDNNDPSTIDRIFVLTITNGEGTLDATIDLDEPGGVRAFSVAPLFGPDDTLFVPMTYTQEVDACGVRRFKRINGTWEELDCLVGSGLVTNPFYLTFGQTNPSTLAYEPKKCKHNKV